MPKGKVIKKSYTPENVEAAVKAIQNGMSLRVASEKYNVPRSTISIKSKGKVALNASMGPSTYLSKEEEQRLCDWIIYLGQRGFPVTKTKLLESVQALVTELGRVTPFVNNKPGRHWFEAFLRRHPHLSKRIAQTLTSTRASVTELALRSWFKEVEEHLTQLNLVVIDPSRIFNCDESGFRLCPELGHVIVKKGAKSVYTVVTGDEKECITVLFMVNAAGSMVPPMVLHAYKRVPYNVTKKIPKDWSMGISDKGWMTAETFYEYISNIFYPWVLKKNIQFPIVLYVDGHSSHVTRPLVNFCQSVQIELIALYPNSTHIIQPLDVSVFHPMKNVWRQKVCNWRLENQGERLRKEDFAPLLKTAIDSIHNLENTIQSGFRTCGLLPFSPDAVNFNILNKNKEPDVEQMTILDSSTSEQHEYSILYSQHLTVFEKNIDDVVLRDFKLAEPTGIWSGTAEFKQLFLYWLKIKGKCGKTVSADVLHTGLNNNLVLCENSHEHINSEIGNINNVLQPLELNVGFENLVSVQPHSGVDVHNSSTLECNLNQELIGNYIINENIKDCSDVILVRERIECDVSKDFETPSDFPTCSSFQEQSINKENSLEDEMPLPFKKTLFWPKPIQKINKGKSREKVPTVATSQEWLKYQTCKEEKKIQIQKEKEDKKQQRIDAKEKKRVQQEVIKRIKKEKVEESKKQKLRAAKETKKNKNGTNE